MKCRIRRGVGVSLVLGLAAGMLVFSGCSSGAASAQSYDMAGGGAAPMPQDPVQTQAGEQPQIARTASSTVVVDDVKVATQKLHDLAANLGGMVMSESISLPSDDSGYGYASMQLSVPSDKLDDALDQIETVGKVTDRNIQAEDVTQQVIDVDSRVKTMQDSIARLQELIGRSGSVADIASVEAQLTQRQADLESLLAVQKNLQTRVATATITVDVSQKQTASIVPRTGFLGALGAGWNAMVATGRALVIVVGALLPWLVLAAIILVPILLVRRHRRAARKAALAQVVADTAAQVPTEPTAS